jgi:hypothetical protein
MDDEDCWVRLGFQASRYNTVDEVQFTINLMVTDRASWARARELAAFLPEIPQVGVEYGRHAAIFWSRRIGSVLSSRADHWWTLTSDNAVDQVADEVVEAVRAHGLPALRAARSRAGAAPSE